MDRIEEICKRCEAALTGGWYWVSDFVIHAVDDVKYLLVQLAERDKEIERLRKAQRWIPVSERLPKEDVPVLVTYIGFTDKKLYSDDIAKWSPELNGYNGGWVWTFDDSDVTVEITHWMPLPEPPKGE